MRSERGQSTVEWLGGTAVVLVLVLIVLGARPGLLDVVGCQVRAQLDRVMTIEQEGSCSPPQVRPRERTTAMPSGG